MTLRLGRLALALSAGDARGLLEHPYLIRDLADEGIAFVALGIDRAYERSRDTGDLYDPLLLASYFHQVDPALLVLPFTAPARTQPWNLARTVLSNDHLARGNGGVLLGRRDAYADAAVRAVDHDAPARATSAEDAQELVEYVDVLRKLWQTWPAESIILDRESGTYARRDLVRELPPHDDHPPASSGPLSLPSSRQGEPVVATWLDRPGDLGVLAESADLLIVADDAGLQEDVEASVPRQYRSRVYAHHRLADPHAWNGVAGNGLLEPAPGAGSIASVIDRWLGALRTLAFERTPNRITARARLSLGEPRYRLIGAPFAFDTEKSIA